MAGAIDPVTLTTATTGPAGSVPAPEPGAAERAKIRELAHEFEALLIGQMLKEMRQGMLDEASEGSGFGNQTMTETVDAEFARAMSRTGGFGLSEVLERAFARQQAGRATAAPGAGAGAPAGLTMPSPSLAMPSPERGEPGALEIGAPHGRAVTSAFGWRQDPFTQQVRFHSGPDLRMAYGEDVKAAAAGRVAFAGEQSGYGLTVVIDHGNGVETRYAHLSGYAVQAGDAVEPGQVVARSGSSGRSTGPHLHFEVLRNGRAVDPTAVLKNAGLVADSPVYQAAD